MRGLVLVFIIAVVVLFFSLLFVNTDLLNTDKNKNNEKMRNLEFSTFTSAVCQKEKDFVYCKDELFVNCNGKVSKAKDVEECNGFRLASPEVAGFAVFESDWKDIRN